jgi:ATP-dependent RNA helicase DHX37/DHR1
LGSQGNCIHYAIAIVAALAVGDPFLHATNKEASDLRQRKEWSNIINKTSDLLAWLSAIGAYEFADNKEEFADKIHLHTKTMKEIHLLRHQLTNMVAEHIGDESMTFQAKLDPPTREQVRLLRYHYHLCRRH